MDRRLRRHCVKKIALILSALSVPLAPAAISQTVTDEAFSSSRHAVEASPPPTFFPHNWIRGYTEFAVAPSHNEPDLGRCIFPQPSTAGGAASQCTAYARYLFSGYIEMHPLGQTFARHLFLFFEPRFSFGRNIPQVSYEESMEPIDWSRLPVAAEFRTAPDPAPGRLSGTLQPPAWPSRPPHHRPVRPLYHGLAALDFRWIRPGRVAVGLLAEAKRRRQAGGLLADGKKDREPPLPILPGLPGLRGHGQPL